MTDIQSLPVQKSLSPEEYQQLMPSLLEAAQMGYTKYQQPPSQPPPPPRTIDPTTIPNYIPPPQHAYSIPHTPPSHSSSLNTDTYTIDDFIRLHYIPLVAVCLFYMFQLQSFKQLLRHFIPWTHSEDGNMNPYGLIISCILFGMSITFIHYVVNTIQPFT